MAALRSEEMEGVLVVSFTDAKLLEETKIQQVGAELLEMVTRATDDRLLLNFSGVSFMSSAMIGKLVLLNKKCKTDGVDLKMCNISSNVMDVFKITKLNKVFDIHPNEEKAVKAYAKKGWFG
ncbi:MAG: STAS domain-containing protein [Pirellulaceae bacterium]|nr:STAS domain-containing protein [Planctomycetales bacterium]